MTKPNDQAFSSVPTDVAGSPVDWEPGLTKREYFAALAMQALMVSPKLSETWEYACELRAEVACIMADALIAELNKKKVPS